MELDVHLQRDGADSWGFRLIGGKDFNMPLTVVKVVPESPAEKAGLNNGDSVCFINGIDSSDLSHDSAKQAVDAADTLALAVKRGLYDPVLDEYEPIYEPIDQEDFDQPSQPTEVDPFAVQQFLDQQCLEQLPELRDIATPGLTDASELQSRSLTASPFVLPTKPYRPFSTEPLAVIPPLEDPIILNPTYKDEFGQLEDGDFLPKTRFKLPISEQYDPDGSKRKGMESTGVTQETTFNEDSTRKETSFEERVKKETKMSEEMQHKTMVEEVKFMEKMKKEIDLDKIEMTAVSLVDESIERAVSVADEIKKEIDVALSESSVVSSQVKESVTVKESKTHKESVAISTESNKKTTKEASQLVELINKTTEEIVSYNGNKSEVSVAKEVAKFETNDKKDQAVVIDERRLSTKQEIEETIVAGSVQKKSEAFDKKVEIKSVDAKQSVEKKKLAENQQKETVEKGVHKDSVKTESVSQSAQKTTDDKKESVSTSQRTGTKTDSKTSKHNVYNIGLQTIPNIKGSIHSSYHYNLLLKTFFLHLTDVMVALSRFILSEPVFNKDQTEVKKDVTSESVSEYTSVSQEELTKKFIADEKRTDVDLVAKQKKEDLKQELVKERQAEKKSTDQEVISTKDDSSITEKLADTEKRVIEFGRAEDVREYLEVNEVAETRMLSGSKMAQLTERKSEELTQRMDAVITEFETKAGLEASAEIRERRSRSRSRIEEEVSKESDPLEWLDKVDKQSQEIIESKTETKSFSSSSESVEKSKVKTVHEKQETKTTKLKEGQQMYVAIVESHVFTNKDAIFQKQIAELSETSSVQSADEVNVTLQASEAIASEKVTLESKQIKQEVADTKLEESRELAVINAQSKTVELAMETLAITEQAKEEKAIEIGRKSPVQDIAKEEIIEPLVVEIQETHTVETAQEYKVTFEETKEEKALESETIRTVQNVVIQEIIEPVVEIQEIKTEVGDVQRVDIKQEDHVMSVSEKTEIVIEESSHEMVQEIKKEDQVMTIIEEKSLEPAVESIKEQAIEVKEVEKDEAVEEVCIEVNLPRPKLTLSHDEASSELKIVKEEVLEVDKTLKLTEESELSVNKHTEIFESESQFTASLKSTMKSYESKEVVQQASFTAESSEQSRKLTLNLDLAEQRVQSQSSLESEPPSTIDTPTPSTVPPTPLTDEYVFKLQIPLPKNRGTTPVPRDCTPSPPIEEDPNIVKKKLVPHIETTLDSPIIYDPPLPTPPEDKVQSPVYTKPGLRGGSDRREFKQRQSKEEILEIERKSTLLASAIDQTIKSIEEYKEEVGIDTKREVNVEKHTKVESTSSNILEEHKLSKQEVNYESLPIIYNGYAKVETKVYDSLPEQENIMIYQQNHIDEQLKINNDNDLSNKINGLVETVVTNNNIGKETTQLETKQQEQSEIKEPNCVIQNERSEDSLEVRSNGTGVEQSNISASFDVKSAPEINRLAVVDTPTAVFKVEEKKDPLEGYRPVQFHPEELIAAKKNLQSIHLQVQAPMQRESSPSYMTASGELLGTHQGIVDGLEEAVVDSEVAKELGKPGITEDKIAELISGESEMLREAHVMGLSRVIKSHMHRADDNSSVDFKKIKPIIESLKDSEVLRALNEELIRTQEERKKEEEKKWTTFMQKPQRPVPRMKFGYYGYVQPEEEVKEPYKVKIVKQPKPKVAPDYKPEDFETGPLPWEERASKEPPPPPVNAEDPILIPEELPEFLEAVDPLPESEVPDLEETGIPLPPPEPLEEPQPPTSKDQEENKEESEEVHAEELDTEAVVEETEKSVREMEQNRLAEQLMTGVQSMVDPNATIDQQLAQMRAQLAALAQLPGVIQQTLDLVTRQLSQLTQQEAQVTCSTQLQIEDVPESREYVEEAEVQTNGIVEGPEEYNEERLQNGTEDSSVTIVEEESQPNQTEEEREKLKKEEEEMLEEQKRIEKQKKIEVWNEVWPWGNGKSYCRQYRINFMKYEKPPVSLDHLQQSETYKLIHNMEQTPVKRVELRTPVIAEADYREKCRSVTPASGMDYVNIPQQVYP